MPALHKPSSQERLLLYTLAALQFTLIMDFMIIMPLGSHLIRAFAITPAGFGFLIAAYGIAAGVIGFLGGFFIDRFNRRNALLVLYAGFTLSSLACAFAPTYQFLLIARIAAGAFGGICGSVLTAMIGDAVPPERRGSAAGTVMVAVPLCSVIGLPAGLVMAGWWGWHSTFFFLSALCLVMLVGALKILPLVPSHQTGAHPMRQMWNIVAHRIHLRAFLLRASLVFSGSCVMPFMAPSMVYNVGLNEHTQIPMLYMLGGILTFFTIPWFGRLSDRFDKVNVLICVAAVGIPVLLIMTRLGPGPLTITYTVTTLIFICMSGRFTPIMALITNAVEPKYRGGFMIVNSSEQFTVGSLGTIVAGMLNVKGDDGRLHGSPTAGWISCGAFAATILFAAWLRKAAPYAARNHTTLSAAASAL